LLEIETCRLEGHFMGDAEQYRPQGEVEQLKAVDPIVIYRQRLLDQGVSAGELDEGEARVRDEVAAAFAFARASATPAALTAYEKVFVTGAVS
jgi:pyruvate dehydrogenase E1 component alpha subunit